MAITYTAYLNYTIRLENGLIRQVSKQISIYAPDRASAFLIAKQGAPKGSSVILKAK